MVGDIMMSVQEIRQKRETASMLHAENESKAATHKLVNFVCKLVGGIAMFTGLALFFTTGNPVQIFLGCSGVLPVAGARIARYFSDKKAFDKLQKEFPEMLKGRVFMGESVLEHSSKINNYYTELEESVSSSVKFDTETLKLDTNEDVIVKEFIKSKEISKGEDKDQGVDK